MVDKMDIDFSFEKVKDKIFFRVVGDNKLNKYKENGPGCVIYNLVGKEMYMIYVVEVNDDMAVICTNILLDAMGCDEEELIEIARKNTERKYPPILKSIENVIFDTIALKKDGNIEGKIENLLDEDLKCEICHEGDEKMYVLTNNVMKYGAGVICYDGVLKKVSEILKSDLYLIPSSVHEVILLPRCKSINKECLDRILNEVNGTFVDREDILGTNVLVYDAKRGEFVI